MSRALIMIALATSAAGPVAANDSAARAQALAACAPVIAQVAGVPATRETLRVEDVRTKSRSITVRYRTIQAGQPSLTASCVYSRMDSTATAQAMRPAPLALAGGS